MTNGIDVATFQKFAELEDPYQLERYSTKRQVVQPLRKKVYVGDFDAFHNPDIPRDVQPSTTHFLQQALTRYELLKLVENVVPIDTVQRTGGYTAETLNNEPEESYGRSLPNVFRNNKTWQIHIQDDMRQKVMRADAGDPDLPVCLAWTKAEVLKWLGDIGMDKYTETFDVNEIDGRRLCCLEVNSLVRMNIGDWNDLRKLREEIVQLSKRPARPWFYARDTRKPPLDPIDLYLDFKNCHGQRSETTDLQNFSGRHWNTLWAYPEKTLRYPGMLYQQNCNKRIDLTNRY
ncbi:hypothetical protein RvY_13498 [Ramazzottius varieornatus]|uniref:SAM domain-containing protein n=1 Tax=Ramazzottius varieornatus TaxID=947166 RepID=A0A1D1VN32_RAMVA|nr:hypothetical protein RvY_13498 [Ramazzottius varieornatus]